MTIRRRTERRQGEREIERLVQARERLFAASDGGSREHPIEVASASLVEPRASSMECPRCGEKLRVRAHEAIPHGARTLRAVTVRCPACGSDRTLWFCVVRPMPQ